MIDLHGAPGSQNGQDNSGLIGPVLFPTNETNADRRLRVLRNLTEEFSGTRYRGAVTGIELLNEPRLSSDFPMIQLRRLYANGSSVAHQASGDADVNVTLHDAFWGPSYWTNYNPDDAAASEPASQLTIETHRYYAFPPLNDVSSDEILDSIGNVSKLLKPPSSGIPPTIAREWSLEANHTSSPSGSLPSHADQARRTWFRLLAESQIIAYSPNGPDQASLGWTYWSWETEFDKDTWSYRKGVDQGYIPADVNNCSTFAFPVLENGCVNVAYNYTAPRHPNVGVSTLKPGSLAALVLALAVIVWMASKWR